MARVLIVDDSNDLRDFLSTLLRYKKFEVSTATSKTDVFSSLSFFRPDIILLDVRLKRECGRALCRQIKMAPAGKNTAVILLSASPDLLENYIDCDADDILEKPFDINALMDKIVCNLGNRVP